MNMTHRRRRFPGITRRSFFGATATAGAGAVMGANLLLPRPAYARQDEEGEHRGSPNPIPETIAPLNPFAIKIHHLPPVPGTPLPDINEPSQITDFNGFVGLTRIVGIGSGTGHPQLNFQADMGFNQGEFVGTDGRRHHGTFAFV